MNKGLPLKAFKTEVLRKNKETLGGKPFLKKSFSPKTPLQKKLLTLAIPMVKVKSFLVLPFCLCGSHLFFKKGKIFILCLI